MCDFLVSLSTAANDIESLHFRGIPLQGPCWVTLIVDICVYFLVTVWWNRVGACNDYGIWGRKIVQNQEKIENRFLSSWSYYCTEILVQNSNTYLISSFVAFIFGFSVSLFTLPIPSGYDIFRLVVFLSRINGISHEISHIEVVHLMEVVKEQLLLEYCMAIQ